MTNFMYLRAPMLQHVWSWINKSEYLGTTAVSKSLSVFFLPFVATWSNYRNCSLWVAKKCYVSFFTVWHHKKFITIHSTSRNFFPLKIFRSTTILLGLLKSSVYFEFKKLMHWKFGWVKVVKIQYQWMY